MRVYRVRYYTEGGISGGFSFHTSYKDAWKAAREYRDECPAEQEPEIERRDVPLTKEGVLDALGWWASHAENG